jgi:hypothetical protein
MTKIGWTDGDAEERLRDLQCGSWETLRIVRLIEGTPATERWLHRHFAAQHVVREWFTFCPEMLTVEPPTLVRDDEPGMALIRAQRGLQAKIARALGVTRAAINLWKRVPAEYVPVVERVSGIQREVLRPDIFIRVEPVAAPP